MNPSGIDANESLAHRSSGLPRLTPLQRYGLAVLSVGTALGLSLLLQHFHFRVPAAVLLFAVAISSWYAGRGPGVLAAILSIISIYWYFVEPVRTIYIYWSEIPYFMILTAFAVLLSWFGTVRRRIEAALRERADLLNLTHDTVFVMDMEGVIKYWNRGAEEQYGWTAEQAIGKDVHDLLKTVFPAPLTQIKAEVTRTGRWEGELLHTRKDGTHVTVASRWSQERSKRGEPVAILETNNDITERKRAEEALCRLNRELRAISNCNQTLLRATDEQSLLERICRIVCEEVGYRMAFVAYAEHDEAKTVRPVAWTGAEAGYLETAGLTWDDTERGRGPTGTAIRSGKSCCIQDFATDTRLAPWRESVLQRGFRSGIGLPLKDEHDNAFGCLSIYSAQPNAFTPEEVRLLEELAADMAFGIVTLRVRAERQSAEEALRINDARYRTAEAVGHVGNWEYDIQTKRYWGSDGAKRMFGFDPGQTDITTDEVENCIPERDRVHQALVDLIEASKRNAAERLHRGEDHLVRRSTNARPARQCAEGGGKHSGHHGEQTCGA
jgi:PAS domain S-box-containing protein